MGTTGTASSLLEEFSSKFAEKLTVLRDDFGGNISGEQLVRCALDIIMIDMRRRDLKTTIESLPRELQNLILHANANPAVMVSLGRQIDMIRSLGE